MLKKFGTFTSFKYPGAIISDKGKVFTRVAQATAVLTKLRPIWKDNTNHIFWMKGETDERLCNIDISVCL
ncbi:MAG: hypothetical protein AB2693_23235 [Candidatus Thiodiazotropha sp.]